MDENTVAEGLEEALAEESEPSTDKSEQEVEVSSKEDKESKTVPYDRFAKVNKQMRAFEDTLEAKNIELSQQAEAVSKLTTLLEAKERDAGYVEQIRNLYQTDPVWKDQLEKLERRLQGVEEEEAVESDSSEEDTNKATQRVLKQTQEALEDKILDQRAEMIVNQANNYAAELLKELPEEYTDLDKERISALWTDSVDWDKVEESEDWNDALADELHRSLEHVLNNVYKEPQGVLAQRIRDELESEPTKEAVTETAQAKLGKLLDADYSGVKEVKDARGNTRVEPEVSDADFSRIMADAMRAGREAEEATRKK